MRLAVIAFFLMLAAILATYLLARRDAYDPRNDDEAHHERPLWRKR